jgi:hypothetical protein
MFRGLMRGQRANDAGSLRNGMQRVAMENRRRNQGRENARDGRVLTGMDLGNEAQAETNRFNKGANPTRLQQMKLGVEGLKETNRHNMVANPLREKGLGLQNTGLGVRNTGLGLQNTALGIRNAMAKVTNPIRKKAMELANQQTKGAIEAQGHQNTITAAAVPGAVADSVRVGQALGLHLLTQDVRLHDGTASPQGLAAYNKAGFSQAKSATQAEDGGVDVVHTLPGGKLLPQHLTPEMVRRLEAGDVSGAKARSERTNRNAALLTSGQLPEGMKDDVARELMAEGRPPRTEREKRVAVMKAPAPHAELKPFWGRMKAEDRLEIMQGLEDGTIDPTVLARELERKAAAARPSSGKKAATRKANARSSMTREWEENSTGGLY